MGKKIVSAVLLIGSLGMLLSVTACNTMAGAGKDVETAGEAINNKAKEVQNDN